MRPPPCQKRPARKILPNRIAFHLSPRMTSASAITANTHRGAKAPDSSKPRLLTRSSQREITSRLARRYMMRIHSQSKYCCRSQRLVMMKCLWLIGVALASILVGGRAVEAQPIPPPRPFVPQTMPPLPQPGAAVVQPVQDAAPAAEIVASPAPRRNRANGSRRQRRASDDTGLRAGS